MAEDSRPVVGLARAFGAVAVDLDPFPRRTIPFVSLKEAFVGPVPCPRGTPANRLVQVARGLFNLLAPLADKLGI